MNIIISADSQKTIAAATTIGYIAGVTVMFAVSIRDLRQADKDQKRAVAFANRLINESWVYLPPEVKDQFQDEVKFFNISVREDI